MNITFVAPRFHTNQVRHVEALQNAGHSVKFLVAHIGAVEDHALLQPTLIPWSPVFIRSRERRSYRGLLPHLGVLWRELRAERPDLIVIRNPNELFGMTTAAIARILRIPIAFYTQGPKYRQRYPLRRRLAKQCLRSTFGAAWMTPVQGDDREARGSDSQTFYVPFVARATPYRKDWPQPNEPIRLIAVGKMEPRKHHIMLVDAFSGLADAMNLTLTIVGQCTTPAHEAYYGRLKESVEASGVAGRIHIQTNVSHRLMEDLYLRHHLFVLPSDKESAAVSVLEAMANGLAVIASSEVGTRWYIEPGRNGLIFKAGDQQSLRDAIQDVVRDRDRLVAMGRKSLELVRQRHSGEAYVRALEQLAEGRQPRSPERHTKLLRGANEPNSPEPHSARPSALRRPRAAPMTMISDPERLCGDPTAGTEFRAR
jgi:glycosyltransferase involved in cell wall biosynthesis